MTTGVAGKTGRRNYDAMNKKFRAAKFGVGQIVRHRVYPFRGVIFDIDPEFANTEEWWAAIPEEVRPSKDQPFYHLLAENADTEYIAYVSEQNLLPDDTGQPLRHPQLKELFAEDEQGRLHAIFLQAH
jgi:heat shock protein HspQ